MTTAVVDVNVVVSGVIGQLGFSRQVLLLWGMQRFDAITSDGMIAEVEAKLRLPRIANHFRLRPDDIDWVRILLQSQARRIPVLPSEVAPVTGDPEDDYVLATVLLGKADYLVTGDRGLLELARHAGAAIVTPKAFVEFLAAA